MCCLSNFLLKLNTFLQYSCSFMLRGVYLESSLVVAVKKLQLTSSEWANTKTQTNLPILFKNSGVCGKCGCFTEPSREIGEEHSHRFPKEAAGFVRQMQLYSCTVQYSFAPVMDRPVSLNTCELQDLKLLNVILNHTPRSHICLTKGPRTKQRIKRSIYNHREINTKAFDLLYLGQH